MRLTRHTDYALRVLMYLARKGDGLTTIKEIAACYAISENHLMKVVHQLGRNGYITTIRGRQGGVRLAAAPDQISIGAVVRSCEEDLCVVECFNDATNTCSITGVCGLSGMIAEALQAFLVALDSRTLADVMGCSPGLNQVLKLT